MFFILYYIIQWYILLFLMNWICIHEQLPKLVCVMWSVIQAGGNDNVCNHFLLISVICKYYFHVVSVVLYLLLYTWQTQGLYLQIHLWNVSEYAPWFNIDDTLWWAPIYISLDFTFSWCALFNWWDVSEEPTQK